MNMSSEKRSTIPNFKDHTGKAQTFAAGTKPSVAEMINGIIHHDFPEKISRDIYQIKYNSVEVNGSHPAIDKKSWWDTSFLTITCPEKAIQSQSESNSAFLPMSSIGFSSFEPNNNPEQFNNLVREKQEELKQSLTHTDPDLKGQVGGPILIGRNHWVHVLIDQQNHRIFYFDPMSASNPEQSAQLSHLCSDDHIDISKKIAHNSDLQFLAHWMKKALPMDKINKYKVIRNTSKFQYDGYNCGPWTALFNQFISDHQRRQSISTPEEMDKQFKSYIHEKLGVTYNDSLTNTKIRSYQENNVISPRLEKILNDHKFKPLEVKLPQSDVPTASISAGASALISLMLNHSTMGIAISFLLMLVVYNTANYLLSNPVVPSPQAKSSPRSSDQIAKDKPQPENLLKKDQKVQLGQSKAPSPKIQ